jgi:recombination protein RecA
MSISAAEKKEKTAAPKRNSELDAAVGQIEKRFGKGSVMRLGDGAKVRVPFIPSGSLLLDFALGISGYPRGRLVEIYGPESSGKTTLALHAIAEAHKLGGAAAFVDAEHALDPAYAKNLGVNVDELIVSQPDYGEQALEITEMLIKSGALDVVVVDSVAALVPRAELEGEMGDSHMGLQARLMSQALRKLIGLVSKTKTSLIFINQIREKIGVFFGNPETTTGGRALKFYTSVRIDVRRKGVLKDGEQVIGNRTVVKVVKNKLAAPFKQVEFDVVYGKGISRPGEVLDLGVDLKILDKTGVWFTYGDTRLGQGRANAMSFLEENPKILDEMVLKIRDAMASQTGKTDLGGIAGGDDF